MMSLKLGNHIKLLIFTVHSENTKYSTIVAQCGISNKDPLGQTHKILGGPYSYCTTISKRAGAGSGPQVVDPGIRRV